MAPMAFMVLAAAAAACASTHGCPLASDEWAALNTLKLCHESILSLKSAPGALDTPYLGGTNYL